nr:uncharacterized protein LOC115259747 [Aedes albopictus]
MLMQELWLASCSWDEEVPDQIKRKWQGLCEQLPGLARFRVERYAFQLSSVIQLHTFADASEAAYGACVYARCVDTEGNICVQLLAAKSRVAPLKRLSIPRLELCAALIGSQLHSRIVAALEMSIDESFFWSDSTVALQWLSSPPSAWKTFVANRVSEVQTLTHGSRWSHVSGFENPADLVSRGMEVDDFVESNLWKYGPQWLQRPELEWPIRRHTEVPEAETERKGVVVAVTTSTPYYNPIFSRYSSFARLTRIVAQCQRFVSNVRSKSRTQPTNSGLVKSQTLSLEELMQAKMTLVRLAQADCFHEELRELQQGRQLPKRSSLRLLSPFIDTEGVLRVGGRLKLSEQPYLSKHPALLPSFHPLSQLIAKSFHYKLIHGGGHLTLSVMREEYWPINGRRLVRSIIRNCFQCARANPVPASQQIGQLPAQRVTVSKPFSITGVDYAGPVYLKAIHKRAAPTKAYICLFVCFTTKASKQQMSGQTITPALKMTENVQQIKAVCKYCGSPHGQDQQCPAWKRVCSNCGKKGHFRRVCFSRGVSPSRTNFNKSNDPSAQRSLKRTFVQAFPGPSSGRKQFQPNTPYHPRRVHAVDEAQNIEEEVELVDMVSSSNDSEELIWAKVGNVIIEMQIDSGVQSNIIDDET